ncbi:MAG: hypothetical protein K8R21_01965 [Leptospira sp.]|nr:hypothetical protein [Leptospira sp.]
MEITAVESYSSSSYNIPIIKPGTDDNKKREEEAAASASELYSRGQFINITA